MASSINKDQKSNMFGAKSVATTSAPKTKSATKRAVKRMLNGILPGARRAAAMSVCSARPSLHGVNVQGAIKAISKLRAECDTKTSFFDIKTGQTVASPSNDTSALQAQINALKGVARGLLGKDRARMWLWQTPVSYNGTAGTALSVASGLTPSATSEWASVIALYDEVKVHKISMKFATIYTAGTSVFLTFIAAGYDSERNTAPTSVADISESSQHISWCQPILAGTPYPTIATKDGFQHFNVDVPSQSVANATPVTGGTGIIANFPGQWMSTLDTADAVGYLRLYSEAFGGTCVITVKVLIAFECEFRERT